MTTLTRQKGYILTGIAALLYVFLGIAFADDFFTGSFWNSDAIFGSTWLSYALLLAIIAGGVMQANKLPEQGLAIDAGSESGDGQIDDPVGWKLLLGNTWFAILWMPLRFFVGQEWLSAGEHKVRADAWMSGGSALKGYWTNSTSIPEQGNPAITYDWFRDFLTYMLDHEWYTWFAKIVAVGEVLVGLGLIFGALVGIAAFFGTVLNFNFLLAGSASTNPVLFGLGVFLVLGWKVAGFIGLDRFLLPILGTPWQPGPVAPIRHQTNGQSTAHPA